MVCGKIVHWKDYMTFKKMLDVKGAAVRVYQAKRRLRAVTNDFEKAKSAVIEFKRLDEEDK
jgi:hypothetical protein